MVSAQRTLVAFMDDPDADKPNPIHSTGVAQAHGFQGALVGGATAFGWTVPTIMQALGDAWLDDGWVHLKFVGPIYPDDVLQVSVDEGELQVTHQGRARFIGNVGLGEAPWFGDLAKPELSKPTPKAPTLPELTLASAPIKQPLAACAVPVSAAAASEFATQRERDTTPAFHGAAARVHPAWIAEQLIHWLHHSYDYGPSIHAQSHIQHLAPVMAGQTFTVTGRCVDAYEKNGHHYIVNDGAIWSANAQELVRLRHTSVFRIRQS